MSRGTGTRTADRMRRGLPGVVTIAMITLLLGVFLFYPLTHILSRAFYADGGFTLLYFRLMLTSRQQWEVTLNSLSLGVTVTFLVSTIALPFAFLTSRYEFRGRRALSGLLLLPLVLPPFVGALGLRQMAGRFGSLNLLLMKLGVIEQPFDLLAGGSVGGVVLMQTLHLVPLMYLAVSAAFAAIDPALEEAARMAGAGSMQIFRRITFPLLLPGYFAGAVLVFVASFTDLGTPLLFEYRSVLPVQIFNMLGDVNENAMGCSLIFFVAALNIALFYLSRSLFGGGYESGGRGRSRNRVKQLTGMRGWGVVTLFTLHIALSLLPHLGVILLSLSDRWFMTILPESYTLENYWAVFHHPVTAASMRNSLLLSAASTTVDLLLGFAIAYLILRTTIRGRSLLDGASVLPLAIPGIVIAFGYIGAFSGTPLDNRTNPVPLLVAAYAVRRLPYMVRSAYAGFRQASVVLEDAGRSVGASGLAVIRFITIPLISPHLIAGSILCFAYAMLEVSDSLLLALEERYYPVSKALYVLYGRPDGPPLASALAVVVMVAIASCFLLAAKVSGRSFVEILRG